MLPSLARLPQQPTGAQLPSDKFKATVRFIRGNPDRITLAIDSEGDVSPEDMEILTRWVVGAFDVLDQPFSAFINSYDGTWIQMTAFEFKKGARKLGCSEEYWKTLYDAQDARYHIEREELLFPDTSGATTWNFVVAITPRQ